VLGVSGGIAAYKAVEVCRRLVDAGAHVAPVMTRGATRFVGPLTLSALASEPVRTSLWEGPSGPLDGERGAAPIPHTRLGQWADLVVVAPATARLLGSYAAGISSDLLTATLLATRSPVMVCPAMHTEMWEHPAVVDNLATLRRRGVHVVEPGEGRLAGGDVGPGRLADPADIVAAVHAIFNAATPAAATPAAAPPAAATPAAGALSGVRTLVTAGGTREPIDAVRYVGNRSSGKQGHAVAAELARRGAAVSLITTVELPGPPGAEVVRVDTAAEMHDAVMARSSSADIVVMAAAVADFRPKVVADHKLKKADGVPELVLEPTPDIAAALGARRRPGQVLVGFAAETATAGPRTATAGPRTATAGTHAAGGGTEVAEAARAKLVSKGLDLIVANDVAAPGVGFGHDTNAVVIVDADGITTEVPLADKSVVALRVVDAIMSRRSGHHRAGGTTGPTLEGAALSPTPPTAEERL
jgi:phosphopantothenoylcysteine decarboxylase/phosphopantothenate--cysteine ligase